MLSYTPITEKEALEERFHLLKEGEYDAVIISSQDKVSENSGNPMMDIMLKVFDENGTSRDVRDFLVFTKSMMWKVIHFCDSAGILIEYESGGLCSEVAIGKRVRVKIKVEEGQEIPQHKLKGSPLGSKYPDKNKIEDYVKKANQKPLENSGTPFVEDDIPF